MAEQRNILIRREMFTKLHELQNRLKLNKST